MGETGKRISNYTIGVIIFLGVSVISFHLFQFVIEQFNFSMETLNILGIAYYVIYFLIGIPLILVLLHYLKNIFENRGNTSRDSDNVVKIKKVVKFVIGFFVLYQMTSIGMKIIDFIVYMFDFSIDKTNRIILILDIIYLLTLFPLTINFIKYVGKSYE